LITLCLQLRQLQFTLNEPGDVGYLGSPRGPFNRAIIFQLDQQTF
jgi:hypothetical protein